MANIQSLRQQRKFKNYMCAFVATYRTGIALENFTEHGLQSVHNHIQQVLGNLPVCQNHCSQNVRDINRWCVTCSRWRTELENFLPPGIRNQRNLWQDRKSWCWPNSAQDIAEVFILPGWDTNNINLQDVSTIFNVWNRCLQFQRNIVQVLAPLKECRNELVHSTANMKLTNAKKKVVFQNITYVINHPDIRPMIPNHADVTQIIRDLKKGKLFQDDIVSSLRNIGMQNANIKAILDNLALEVHETNRTMTLLLRMFDRLQKNVARQTFVISTIVIVLILLLVLSLSQSCVPVCTVLSKIHFPQTEDSSGAHKDVYRLRSAEGCLSEVTDNKELGRISLFEYISHHQTFVGRDWLIKKIDTELQSQEVNYRGILLEAGIGYGKSALMKHIICASKQSPASRLRSRLIAYHVCRFDVLLSKQAHVFVLRLMDLISSQMPILANEINSCKEVFDRKMCEKDPNGCLDQCIMIPLKTCSHLGTDPVIIAIDGLDECYDRYRDINEILALLKQRLYRFPPWVKFLIISRTNQPRLRHLTKELLRFELQDESEENINDIKTYLQQSSVNKSALDFSKFASIDLVNFQLLTLLIKDNKTEDESTLPISLDRYYDEQFNRLFSSEFAETKQILEVMCTTFQPSTKDNIWNVLSNTTKIPLQQFDKSLKMLDNFFRQIGGEFHLIHESLQQWLMSPTNEDFFVDIENGHKMNALYIFRQIDNGPFNNAIVDLAIHVAFSTENVLRQKFLNLSEMQVNKFKRQTGEYPIVQLAKKVDSFIATDILASHFRDVDRKNKDNHTALFIAASLGHSKTFEALIKWNSVITFRTNSYNNIINFEHALKVSYEHMFWGYGILDIAAQNGHSSIVEYVLRNNLILFDYPVSTLNSMMLLPVHLACKRGHLGIVKLFHWQYKWMLDWQCLYYASEIGHINLVQYILNSNVRDKCCKCNTNFHWVPDGHLRVQGQMLYSEERNYSYVLFDDWNNITCESALHVAVRENKLDVVKLLVSQRKHAAKCIDRGGRIPALAAVQYGFRDIVEYFVSSGLLKASDRCSDSHRLTDTLKLHENEILRLEQYFCETKMSVSHIIAKYDRLWVADMLHAYENDVDWNARDSLGCYPIHIASCHGNTGILKKLFDLSDEDFRYFECLNGSNPLHSAAVCGSVSATEFLLLRYLKYENESKSVKMSYINHAILRENDMVLAKDVSAIEKNASTIIAMLITEDSDLHVKDELNRNILHRVIQKGHFYIILHLFSYYPKTVRFLLKAVDNSNSNPLYYGIHKLEPFSQFYISPNVFTDEVLSAPLHQMSAKEYSLLVTLNFMIKFNKLSIDQNLVKLFVRKQCLNIITFLLENPDSVPLGRSAILSAVIEHDRHGLQMLAYFIVTIKKLISNAYNRKILDALSFNNCYELTNKCQLHLIALKYLKVSKIFSLLHIDFFHKAILTLFFPQKRASLMSKCYDAKGYNVLERAVQGGSPNLVRHLIEVGVRSDLEKITLIQMALNGLKYRAEDEYFAFVQSSKDGLLHVSYITHESILQKFGSDTGYTAKATLLTNLEIPLQDFMLRGLTLNRNNSDILISKLLGAFHSDIMRSDICNPTTRQFSVIHRLAFEGLLTSVKLAVKYWGKDILQCQNKDGFTPLYMSKVFKYDFTTNYILNQGITLQLPLPNPEVYFLFKLRFKYFFSRNDEKHIQCIMSYTKNVPNTTYRKIKAYNCAKKVAYAIKSETLMKSINEFKWSLSFYIEMDTWEKLMTKILKAEENVPLKPASYLRYANSIWKSIAGIKVKWYRAILNLKLLNEKTSNSIVSHTDTRFIRTLDAESRVCKYLRISYKQLLLDLLRSVKDCNCGLSYIEKEFMLNEINRTVADIDLYRWDTSNCTEIEEFCAQRRALMDIFKKVRQTFILLRINLLSISIKQPVYFLFGNRELDFRTILQNPSLWLRMYHRYDYMNELQTSSTYKESYFYKSNDIEMLTSHMTGVSKTLKFIEWNWNAAEILQNYLKEISIH